MNTTSRFSNSHLPKALLIAGVLAITALLALKAGEPPKTPEKTKPTDTSMDSTTKDPTAKDPTAKPTEYTQEELKKKLTPLQYSVTKEEGTEPPFKNEYWDNHKAGIYVDVISGDPLFSSLDKYDSGTGWPSFTKPLVQENFAQKNDTKLGMSRTEVRSKKSDSHLGHVFDDGPEPTGQRYCMNSASMRFVPVEKLKEEGYEKFLPLFEKK